MAPISMIRTRPVGDSAR